MLLARFQTKSLVRVNDPFHDLNFASGALLIRPLVLHQEILGLEGFEASAAGMLGLGVAAIDMLPTQVQAECVSS
jgi:hypothetical protein